MNTKTCVAAFAAAVLLSGCTNSPGSDFTQPPVYHVHLVELGAGDTAGSLNVTAGDSDQAYAVREAPPKGGDPADYGANSDGAYWQDDVMVLKAYRLEVGAKITTHTHGIVVYASESITIDGLVIVRSLGAPPNETGYPTTRAATMNRIRGYGETDPATGEPLLWGAGGDSCSGGGYIILNAPQIYLNGALDAGSDCAQGGVVYLEGTVTGKGTIEASLIIHRGTTA
jgi:hypothetical protein